MPFTRIRDTMAALTGIRRLGGDSPGTNPAEAWVRIFLSVAAFMLGAWLILSGRNAAAENFGFGIVGTVIGYWLR